MPELPEIYNLAGQMHSFLDQEVPGHNIFSAGFADRIRQF